MKVTVNKDLCSGCGLCADNCPEIFEMKDDVATVKNETVDDSLSAKVKEQADNCPVEAITGGKKQVHVIDQAKCTKCGTCLEVCPPRFNAVIRLSGVREAELVGVGGETTS